MYDPSVEALARRLAQRNAQVRVPVQAPTTFRQVVITDVNHGGSNVGIQFPGSSIVVPTVSYILNYTPSHLPQVGHTAWARITGSDVQVYGQHISSGFVTL